MVVEGSFDHIIRNKGRLYVTKEDQLLLYVRGEGEVGKDHMIYALEIGFILLNKRRELMISKPTECVTKSIEESTVYTTLSISTCKAENLCTNVSRLWTHQSSFIIDELSMIQLEFFTKMDKQIRNARGAIVS